MPQMEALGFFPLQGLLRVLAEQISLRVSLMWYRCSLSGLNTQLALKFSQTQVCPCWQPDHGMPAVCLLRASFLPRLVTVHPILRWPSVPRNGGGGAVWSLLISLDSLCLVCVFLTLSLVAVTPPFSAGAISVHPISLAAVAIGKRRVVGHDWHCTVGSWCARKASVS